MGLVLDGDQPAVAGDRIVRNGEDVGQVTSACLSLALKRPIAMGYLKRGAYDAGQRVQIMHEAERISAQTVARPFVS